MNAIVVGCGRVGSQLATMLSVEGHNVVVIDKKDDAFRRLGTAFNGVTLKGLGFDEDVLEEAGVRETDAFAAVTDLDNTNLMAAEVARKIFDVPHVVVRMYNPVRERTYQQLGMDYVCGTTLVAESLLDKIKAGHGHHVANLGDIEVVEFRASAEVAGKRLREVELEHRFRIAAIVRGSVPFVPEPDTIIEPGDFVVGAIKQDAFARIERFIED